MLGVKALAVIDIKNPQNCRTKGSGSGSSRIKRASEKVRTKQRLEQIEKFLSKNIGVVILDN